MTSGPGPGARPIMTGMTDSQQRELILLVMGGADLNDAARSLKIDEATLSAWQQDEAFNAEIEQAEARARTMIDTGKRKPRPGEWERRKGLALPQGAERHPSDPTRVRCQARAKSRDGAPCKFWSIPGGTVCRFHGGEAPQVQRAAKRRLAVHTLGQLMERMGHAAEEDPLEAILVELSRSAVMVESLQLLVSGLELDPGEGEAIAGPDRHGELRPHVWVEMLADERDRKARLAKAALEAGVAERQVRVHEAQAVMLAQVINAALDDPELGLDAAGQQRARQVFGRHLRALPSRTA